uniref:Restriction endonuclease n=1 Tax=Pithovirus LCPAC403 TaxID=2506596 RepID=A0A481ZAQ1_9VIRU|nr:MAG: restriction endonuclease [Pithovirus LCPAC403]
MWKRSKGKPGKTEEKEPRWKSEEKCRDIFESLFQGYKFPKCRPYFLQRLELDGYSTKLLLAFEFDGQQHFQHVKHFHKTKKEFQAQQARDKKKNHLCKKNGVKLVRVPYNYNKDGLTMENYIVGELKKLGFKFNVIMVPKYIAIVEEEYEEVKIDETIKIKLNIELCNIIGVSSSNLITTRERIMSNRDKLDKLIPKLRNAFELKSTSQPKSITGYLSFINSVLKKSKAVLKAIEPGVYELRKKV